MKNPIQKTESLGKLAGVVQKGRGQGRNLGFPTANLRVASKDIPVSEGVYAAYAKINDRVYKSAVSVGVSPLFSESTTSNVEVHIMNFDEDIYGKTVEIEFVKLLRPMMKFSSVEELITTVKQNIEEADHLLQL